MAFRDFSFPQVQYDLGLTIHDADVFASASGGFAGSSAWAGVEWCYWVGGRRPMAMTVVPLAKAVYLCDDVVEDPSSRKIHLLGLFNAVRPTSYPHVLGRLCVFA